MRQKPLKILLCWLACGIVCCLALTGCRGAEPASAPAAESLPPAGAEAAPLPTEPESVPEQPAIAAESRPEQPATEPIVEAEPATQPQLPIEPIRGPGCVNLVAVGDNLLHLPIMNGCKTAGGYDFTPLYKQVKELVSAADLAFVNQEGPIGGAGSVPSGYPLFNAPAAAGLALTATGFNIINQANNHALDQGTQGLLGTIAFWQEQPGAVVIGVNASEQERARVKVVEVQGYRFAWLAYTYGANGQPLEHSYLLNLIDKDAMAEDIAKARAVADAVIVSIHWGEEYQQEPSPQQRELAQFLADQGVMLVIGHHPHVAQPLEWLQGKDGHPTLVMYSLGNFISSQNRRYTMLEGMLRVTFRADADGLAIASCGVVPLVMHYERGYQAYAVYPLRAYTEDLARRHYVNQLDKPVSMAYFSNLAREVWGGYCDNS